MSVARHRMTPPGCPIDIEVDFAARQQTAAELKVELEKSVALGLLKPAFAAQVLDEYETLDAQLIQIVGDQVLLVCAQCPDPSSCRYLKVWKASAGRQSV